MVQQSPRFIPDPYGLWKAVVHLDSNRSRSYAVVGWAVFRGFAVEPMVFDPALSRNLTVKDLATYSTPAGANTVLVTLERV